MIFIKLFLLVQEIPFPTNLSISKFKTFFPNFFHNINHMIYLFNQGSKLVPGEMGQARSVDVV